MIQGFQQNIAAISLDRKIKHTVIYFHFFLITFQLSEGKYYAVS